MNLSFLRIFHYFFFWNVFIFTGLFGKEGSTRLTNVRDDLSTIFKNLEEIKAEMYGTDITSPVFIASDENKTQRGKKHIPDEYRSDKNENAKFELRQILDEIKMELPLLKKNLNLAYAESSSVNNNDLESTHEKKDDIQKDLPESIGHSSTKVDLEGITQVIRKKNNPRNRNIKVLRELLENIRSEIPTIKNKITDYSDSQKKSEYREAKVILSSGILTNSEDKKFGRPKTEKIGFYLVPGLVTQYGQGMKWKSALGENYKLDESFGFGISGRFGYRWERFFTEMQMDFIKSDIQKIEFGNLPLRSSGQSDHLGFNFNFGTYLPVHEGFIVNAGLGVGISGQDMDVRVSDLNLNEHDTIFSPQVFIGFDYFPNDTFFINWRYRYAFLSEMKKFTSRNLHLLETSFGWML